VLRLIENVLKYAGLLLRSCPWIANLQSNFASCVPTFAMHVLENVTGTTLTTARDARSNAAAVLKNVEGWLDKSSPVLFLYV
jgi:hypothetical protein